jgi:hypothetical protein
MKSILAFTVLVGCAAPVLPQASAPAEPVTSEQRERATRWTTASIACFSGGVWNDLQGDRPDACAVLATDALGAPRTDDATRAALRAIDPRAVASVVDAIEAAKGNGALVRAVADASREAMVARATADRLRNSVTGEALDAADDAALSAHTSLAKLAKVGSPVAAVVTLVLAADRLENVRGLATPAKLAAATPVFAVVFNVARPSASAPGAWLGFVSDAARASGREVPANGTTREREQAAFVGVAAGLADRLELASKPAPGEAKTVATIYAQKLHDAVAAHAKKSAPTALAATE